MKIIVAALIVLISLSSFAREEGRKPIINGSPIICDREAYNCPSYKKKSNPKRLKNCKDVSIVWETCKYDVHGLDADHDNYPCENDCGSN